MESKAVGNVLVWRNCKFRLPSDGSCRKNSFSRRLPSAFHFRVSCCLEPEPMDGLEMIVQIPVLLPPSRPRPTGRGREPPEPPESMTEGLKLEVDSPHPRGERELKEYHQHEANGSHTWGNRKEAMAASRQREEMEATAWLRYGQISAETFYPSTPTLCHHGLARFENIYLTALRSNRP